MLPPFLALDLCCNCEQSVIYFTVLTRKTIEFELCYRMETREEKYEEDEKIRTLAVDAGFGIFSDCLWRNRR